MKPDNTYSLTKTSTSALPRGGNSVMFYWYVSIAVVAMVLYGFCAQPASAQSGESNDLADYSHIIAETERRFSGFYENVDLHIVDPAFYLSRPVDTLPPALDMSGLDARLHRRVAGQLPLLTTMRITREIPGALLQGEAATGVYALANGRTLCIIAGGNSEMTLAGAVARYTGLDAPAVPDWVRFNESDLLRFLLHHEIAHCSARPAAGGRNWTAHDIHVAENLGDAFAVLMHLRTTGDETLPHLFAMMRESALVNLADREHMTVRSIEAALEWGLTCSKEGRLSSMDTPSLLEKARELAQANAYTPAEFAALASDTSRRLHQNLFASQTTSLGTKPTRP